MHIEWTCKFCSVVLLDSKSLSCMGILIIFYCIMNRILDNLPLVVPYKRPDTDSLYYQHGFDVGFKAQYTGVSSRLLGSCEVPSTLWVNLLSYQSSELFADRARRRGISSTITCHILWSTIRMKRWMLPELLGLKSAHSGNLGLVLNDMIFATFVPLLIVGFWYFQCKAWLWGFMEW